MTTCVFVFVEWFPVTTALIPEKMLHWVSHLFPKCPWFPFSLPVLSPSLLLPTWSFLFQALLHPTPALGVYFVSPPQGDSRKWWIKMGLEANSEVWEDRVYYKLGKESVRLSLHEPELYIIAIISKQRLHNAQPTSALVNFKWLSELIEGKWSSGRYHMNSLNFCQKTMFASWVTIVSKNNSG